MTQRSDQYDVALLAAMAALTPDTGANQRALRERFEGWCQHPLCAPRGSLPARFWGPEQLDPAAVLELAALASPDAEVKVLRAALEGSTEVIDVGGGGLVAHAFSDRCPVIVVEPSAARRAQLPSDLIALDGRPEAIPLGDSGADGAIAHWVLQCADDPIAAIDELERVARRRVAILQAAPNNDLVALYNRAAALAGLPPAHHGWLLSQAATRLELAGLKVTLEHVPIAIRAPAGGTPALAELLVRLHFSGHPAAAAMIAATGGYIDARLAEAGALSADAVLLVARR